MKNGSMICNILGLVFVIPSTICSTVCAAGVMTQSKQVADGTDLWGASTVLIAWGGLFICIVASILGFIALGKPKTPFAYVGGAFLILGGFLSVIQLFFGANVLAVIVGILYIVAGILCILNKEGAEARA